MKQIGWKPVLAVRVRLQCTMTCCNGACRTSLTSVREIASVVVSAASKCKAATVERGGSPRVPHEIKELCMHRRGLADPDKRNAVSKQLLKAVRSHAKLQQERRLDAVLAQGRG